MRPSARTLRLGLKFRLQILRVGGHPREPQAKPFNPLKMEIRKINLAGSLGHRLALHSISHWSR